MKLKIKDVEFRYASTPILENICMELAPSEILAIVGPNGVGKSTLIRCIDRILKPQKGSMLLDGREIKEMSMTEIARHMGYVPQSSSGVFPVTVFDMILMGRRPHLGWRSSVADIEKVVEVLKLMEIEDLALHDFNELSGGQQQKVLIARALAQEPEVLLLDEPTSNLDIRHQLEVMETLKKLVMEDGISAIMAVHDLNLASRYADKVIMMNAGSIFSAGDPASVLTPGNIRSVYGVEAVVKNYGGRPYIMPIRPVRKMNGGRIAPEMKLKSIFKGHEVWLAKSHSNDFYNGGKDMNNTKKKIKDYWNERSSTFDLSPGHVIGSREEEEAWKSLFQDKFGDGVQKILDVGTGTGFLSLILAEMGYDVVGVDVSEKMIEKAKKKAVNRGLKVEFKLGDAEDLPFENGSFDAIVNRAVLWTLPRPRKALAEWRRVLKPGRKLCFFLHEPHYDGITQRFRRQLGNILILLMEKRNPWHFLYHNKKLGIELLFRDGMEPSVITKILEDTGFELISAEPMEEIDMLKRENMPLRYKITTSNHIQYCYTAVKPKVGKIS